MQFSMDITKFLGETAPLLAWVYILVLAWLKYARKSRGRAHDDTNKEILKIVLKILDNEEDILKIVSSEGRDGIKRIYFKEGIEQLLQDIRLENRGYHGDVQSMIRFILNQRPR